MLNNLFENITFVRKLLCVTNQTKIQTTIIGTSAIRSEKVVKSGSPPETKKKLACVLFPRHRTKSC